MIDYKPSMIRRLRKSKGLTQAQLAHRLGSKRQWVMKLEAGEHSPTMKTFVRVLRALEVESVDDVRPFFALESAKNQANHAEKNT